MNQHEIEIDRACSILAEKLPFEEYGNRVRICLSRANIRTVGQVCRTAEGDMLKIRGFWHQVS